MRHRYHRWTEADHAQVIALSAAGLSAEEIATRLGVSVAMVYKKRAELGVRPTKCQHCRGPLPIDISPGRPVSYCSPACKSANAWAYAHNAILDARAKTCVQCGAALDLEYRSVRYCGKACSQRAWYESTKSRPEVTARRNEARKRYAKRVRAGT